MLFEKLSKKFGAKHQYGKVVEELLELAIDTIHFQDKKISLSKLIGEIADVKIQLEQ